MFAFGEIDQMHACCVILIFCGVVSELRISGRGTNSCASHTTRIRWPMNPSSETPSWVRHSPAQLVCSRFVCVLFVAGLCSVHRKWVVEISFCSCPCRTTCVAPLRSSMPPFPSCGVCHFRAASSPNRNVLQVGATRGLQQPVGAYAPFRLRGRFGNARPRTLSVTNAP